MNLYKLARDLRDFINACQEEATRSFPELGGHIDVLDPFSEQFDEWELKDRDTSFMPHTNYRIDIFETESGNLVYAAYSPQAAATNPLIMNSHSTLAGHLAETHHLNYKKRWCGFYSRVTGNGKDNLLILYSMSSDYPHNQYAEEIVEKFSKEIMKSTWGPSTVVVLSKEYKIYTKEENDVPF